jgi:hypothetical protein
VVVVGGMGIMTGITNPILKRFVDDLVLQIPGYILMTASAKTRAGSLQDQYLLKSMSTVTLLAAFTLHRFVDQFFRFKFLSLLLVTVITGLALRKQRR